MVHVLRSVPERKPVAAVFVVDFESGGWIRADKACFFRSDRLKTPMGGGVAAFKDCSRAEAAAAMYRGRILRFDELARSF